MIWPVSSCKKSKSTSLSNLQHQAETTIFSSCAPKEEDCQNLASNCASYNCELWKTIYFCGIGCIYRPFYCYRFFYFHRWIPKDRPHQPNVNEVELNCYRHILETDLYPLLPHHCQNHSYFHWKKAPMPAHGKQVPLPCRCRKQMCHSQPFYKSLRAKPFHIF